MEESPQVNLIRELLKSQTDDSLKDHNWRSLFDHVTALGSIDWNDKWGVIEEDSTGLLWTRPDNGPKVSNGLPWSKKSKVAGFILHAILIEELHKCGLESYVEVGKGNWNRCKVFYNDREQSHVIWADALSGQCQKAKLIEGKLNVQKEGVETTTVRGRIVITVADKPLTFF